MNSIIYAHIARALGPGRASLLGMVRPLLPPARMSLRALGVAASLTALLVALLGGCAQPEGDVGCSEIDAREVPAAPPALPLAWPSV